MKKEHRVHPRYRVQLLAKMEEGQRVSHVKIIDLSMAGCRIVCKQLLNPSAHVRLTFFLKTEGPQRWRKIDEQMREIACFTVLNHGSSLSSNSSTMTL